jgi:8-oxo-dGTP pyrophosphatase MutT (NUDIX family)
MRLTESAPLAKVTAFVTRGATPSRELLVFRHPLAGVQIPAGTVEAGESAATAALRETSEETGLTAVTVAAYLGARRSILRNDLRGVMRRAALLTRPGPDAPVADAPSWFLGLRRGLFVRLLQEEGGWAEVAFEEFDDPAHLAAAPARRMVGWLPSDAVTASVERHFFHLTAAAPTFATWVQHAEEWEFRFELFWVPLAHPVVIDHLVPSQAAWLDEYAGRLRG